MLKSKTDVVENKKVYKGETVLNFMLLLNVCSSNKSLGH
jgi:hypothetical protein